MSLSSRLPRIRIRTRRILLRRRNLLLRHRVLKVRSRTRHRRHRRSIIILFSLPLHQVVVLKETVDTHRHPAVRKNVEVWDLSFRVCRRVEMDRAASKEFLTMKKKHREISKNRDERDERERKEGAATPASPNLNKPGIPIIRGTTVWGKEPQLHRTLSPWGKPPPQSTTPGFRRNAWSRTLPALSRTPRRRGASRE